MDSKRKKGIQISARIMVAATRGHLAMSCPDLEGAQLAQWKAARSANNLEIWKPTTKNYPDPKVNHALAKKAGAKSHTVVPSLTASSDCYAGTRPRSTGGTMEPPRRAPS